MRGLVSLGIVVGVWACTGGLGDGTEDGSGAAGAGAANGGSNSGAGGPSGQGGSASGGSGGAITVPVDTPLNERLSVTDVSVAAGAKAGVSNWRIWGRESLGVAPVFTVPLANCGMLVGYTSGDQNAPTAHVVVLDAGDEVQATYDLGSYELRGLAAEPDGHFGALLWDDGSDRIYVGRYDFAGTTTWPLEELTNASNTPDDFGIGDSRLEFGGGEYGAYYHVHSDSGHEGDTLKWVDAATGTESTGWSWGCSHSMSAVLRYNASDGAFMPACVTDCYPGTSGMPFSSTSIGGIYVNHNDAKIIDVDAGCNGSVAGELGTAAVAPSGWKVVFNAHQAAATLGQSSYDPNTMNQDIGFVSVDAGHNPGAVVWLTSTDGVDEADASIARFAPEGDAAEQYVVGWVEDGTTYRLARIASDGSPLEGPIDVTATAKWGRRDDPFRAHAHGDVVWSWFDGAGDTTLHVARVVSGQQPSCASF